jgi:hypothetical protein
MTVSVENQEGANAAGIIQVDVNESLLPFPTGTDGRHCSFYYCKPNHCIVLYCQNNINNNFNLLVTVSVEKQEGANAAGIKEGANAAGMIQVDVNESVLPFPTSTDGRHCSFYYCSIVLS